MCGRFIPLLGAAKMRRILQIVAGVAAVGLFGGLNAQAQPSNPPTSTSGASTVTKTIGNVDWGGLNWGLGIATDFDLGGTRVKSAQIVGGTGGVPAIVRVDDISSNANVGFVLEMHYFLRDFTWSRMQGDVRTGACLVICNLDVATGPFVAIEVGNGTSATPAANNPITGYALGWMIGLHHLKVPDACTGNNNISKNDNNNCTPVSADTKSWNFGVGLRIDPTAQVLGDGFGPNLPPPAGETAIRYKTEPRMGIMLLSSFSF